MRMAEKRESSLLADAASGRGVSLLVYLQLLVVLGGLAYFGWKHEEYQFVVASVQSPVGLSIAGVLLSWLFPLQEVAYILDRIGAIRAQLKHIVPYSLDLLPTLPKMIPFTKKIIDNIEQVGPFIPVCMQPGCKEYMVPLMPELMPDLEVVLPAADTLKPVMPKLAPHMKEILPYTKELLPHAEALVCIVQVDGWWKMNPYMPQIVPHIDKIAPHCAALAPHLPAMLPYIEILVKHMDNLVDQLDETVAVMDKLIPLMPLMPAADQAGLLSQKMAFRALPTVVGLVPLSNNTTGRAALQAAEVHTKLLAKAQELQVALQMRYKLYQQGTSLRELVDLRKPIKALEDAAPHPPHEGGKEEEEEEKN